MNYHVHIDINEGLINFELKNYGEAIVIVPAQASQDDIDAAIHELRSKYRRVEVDRDGDLIVTN